MDIGKISSPGIGSNLDVNGIVNQLMTLERQPVTLLQKSQTKLETQLSGMGQLQSSLSALGDAARALTTTSTWQATTVSSADSAAVSATSSGATPAGTYSVMVQQLASAQSVASATVPGPTHVVGTGMLHIDIGQWFSNPPDFTPTSGSTQVSIEITADDNTLEKIRDKINAAQAGVSASIVTDSTGSRLSVRSSETGAANGFRISVQDDDGTSNDASGLSMLAYDPASNAAGMALMQGASNAQLTINNIPIDSESNSLTNVLDGLSVTLSRTTTSPVDLSVKSDSTALTKAVTDFSTAYNNLVSLMRKQTAYDADTKTAGPLQGDRTAVGMLNRLRTLVGSETGATSAFSRLADIGLEPQRDGTLKVNTTKLDAAVSNVSDLKTFFSRDDTGTENDGFATMLRQFADLETGVDGSLTTRQDGLRDRIKSISQRVTDYESRLSLRQKSLLEQYTKLDTNMASLSSLQSYVAQQITNWNK